MLIRRQLILAPALLVSVMLASCGTGEAELGGVMSDPPQAPIPEVSTTVPSPSATAGTEPTPTPPPSSPTPSPSSDASSDRSSAAPKDPPVIVIDPGHSGESIRSTEPTTGLTDFDYPNAPELSEVWQVSRCVAEGLRDLDYTVIMTKESAGDSVGLVDRAEIANEAEADLAISVHNDHSQGPDFQAVYSQRGVKEDGDYGPMWRGSDDSYTEFDLPEVAKRSARYARVMARERAGAQDRPVDVAEFDFVGREGLEPGNIPMVMLFAEVPWVYHEAGAQTGGDPARRMPRTDRDAYAQGLFEGIVAAVPPPGGDDPPALQCD